MLNMVCGREKDVAAKDEEKQLLRHHRRQYWKNLTVTRYGTFFPALTFSHQKAAAAPFQTKGQHWRNPHKLEVVDFQDFLGLLSPTEFHTETQPLQGFIIPCGIVRYVLCMLFKS